MNDLLLEFLSNILDEDAELDNQQLTYQDSSGKQRTVTVKTVRTAGEKHKAWNQYQALLRARKGSRVTDTDTKAVKEPVVKSKIPSQSGVTANLITTFKSPAKNIVSKLRDTNRQLVAARRAGRAGAGGQKASYGEAGLTQLANDFAGKGFSRFIKTNQGLIDKKSSELRKKVTSNKRNMASMSKLADQLGIDITSDGGLDKTLRYYAAREVYVEREISSLRKDKNSVLYSPAGFNGDENAAIDWAAAQFDGAIASLQLVEQGSLIDTTKPYTIIQAEGRADSHDGALREYLSVQAANATSKADKTYYEHQLHIFDHLKFHDTMAVGVDSRGRLSIYHISNKKGNDLQDMWNNTTPVEAIELFKKGFASRITKSSAKQTETVLKVLDSATLKVSDSLVASSQAFSDMKFDEKFMDVVEHMSSGKKDYTQQAMPAGYQRRKFENDPTVIPQLAKLKNLSGKGRDAMKNRLTYIKLYSQWLQAQASSSGKPFKLPTNIIRLMTKVAEVLPTIRKHRGDNFTSPALKVCEDVKSGERDILGNVHTEIVEKILEADKGLAKKNSNGPHVQAYIGTVLSSMHFDAMVINYDRHLGVVTGIRGSEPDDFRNCLATISGFKGDVSKPESRVKLINHLLNTCRINPSTRAIEIVTADGAQTIAEDSWRTSGNSKKVEKRIGNSLRNCIKNRVDAKRKTNPPFVLDSL